MEMTHISDKKKNKYENNNDVKWKIESHKSIKHSTEMGQ